MPPNHRMQPRRWSEEPPFATEISPPRPCDTRAEIARNVLIGTGNISARTNFERRMPPDVDFLMPLAPYLYGGVLHARG